MFESLRSSLQNLYKTEILGYFENLSEHPLRMIASIFDIIIVIFLIYAAVKYLKDTRAWQLLKGIAVLIICTIVSGLLNLTILNYILTSIMMYGGLALIVVFQPELRRLLEQLGANKFKRVLGFTKDEESKTKETVYRVAIAATELAKTKTGALIVLERDIKIKDIINTGIAMNSEVSPQLLVNIFVPNTPLHDGAVVISDNKIAAASCMLPLSNDESIPRNYGTRHRAAIGISNQCDAIAVVVSEETGKISVAKDGTLIADVKEDVLKKILLKNLVIEKQQPEAKTNPKTIETEKEIKTEIKPEENKEN